MRTIDHLITTIEADTAGAARMAKAFADAQTQVERFERLRQANERHKHRGRTVRNRRDAIGRNAPCPVHPDRKFKHCACYRPQEKPA